MAITDNTAKWQVKKLTNFTDKSAEIATQAQAEEGVDNTKVMTPLRVKNAIDKQRPLKTFTSLEQIGLDTNASETDIASAMPTNSTLMFNVYNDAFPNLTVPFMGRLKVTRWGGETVKFELCRTQAKEYYVGVVLSISAGFQGWQKLVTTSDIATQAEAEAGTDNTTVMTPKGVDYRLNKDRGIKTYNSLSNTGVNKSTVTWVDIHNALPDYSELIFGSRQDEANTPLLELPNKNNFFRIRAIKYKQSEFTILTAFLWSGIAIYEAFVDSSTFTGWQKLATNGALSMPSLDNKISISMPVSAEAYNSDSYYTAPSDGWIVGYFYNKTSANPITVGFYTGNTRQHLVHYETIPYGDNGYVNNTIVIPVAKGTRVWGIVPTGGQLYGCYFLSAQSEV